MSKSRVIICIILLIGLCFPIWPSANREESRHTHSITQFKGGIENKALTFMMEGSDSSLKVELPECAKIESATVDIEGRIVAMGDNAIVNFTDTTNNKAWEDETNTEYPVKSAPSKFMTTAFTVNDYNEVNALDKSSKATMGGATSTGCPKQLFEFNLSSYAVVGFEVFWAGSYLNWNSGNTDGMNVSIWNVTSKTWEIIGGYLEGWGVTPAKDHYFNKSCSANPMDYIHPSSKLLYVIAAGPMGAGFSYVEIYTNYIGINITQSSTPSFPKDPYLDIGDDDDKEWTLTGDLANKVRFSGNSFINELQEHVDTGTVVQGKVQIPFVFGVAAKGELFISNLTIVYTTNKAPSNTYNILPISFYEDSGWVQTDINLTNYFSDLDDIPANLTFQLNGNTPDIWGGITPGYVLNFTASDNYFGMAEFNISCTDKGHDGITSADDICVYSNNFTVTVIPTNDKPVIKYIDDIIVLDNEFYFIANEDEYLNFTVIAQDIDGDEIIYSKNVNDKALTMKGNNISFLPSQEYVGLFNFTITATETNTSELYDFVNISIDVKNINDPPTMEKLNEIMMMDEDTWLNFSIIANDPDLLFDQNEKLTFSTNFSDAGLDTKQWMFDGQTAEFSFLPDNSMVGKYFVNFSVQDHYSEKDWSSTIIEVKNVNDPPVAKQISFLIVDADDTTTELENLTISFSTETAIDPDIIHGDTLSYSWDFDSSNGILVDAFGQDVKWTYQEPGKYTVTLTVADTGSPELTNSTSILMQVLAPQDKQPEPEPEDEDNDTSKNTTDKEKEADDENALVVWTTMGVIIVIVVIVSILGLIAWKKKKDKLEEETEKSGAEGGEPTMGMGYPAAASIPPGYPMQPTPYMALPQEQWASAYGMQPVSYYPPVADAIPLESNITQESQQPQMEFNQQQQTVTTEQTLEPITSDEQTLTNEQISETTASDEGTLTNDQTSDTTTSNQQTAPEEPKEKQNVDM